MSNDPLQVATANTKDHTLSADVGRSFTFAKDGTWIYGFHVTWVPGFIHISGDIGDLTLQHYGAFHSLRNAMTWLAHETDDTYQLSKVAHGQRIEEFDVERTVQTIEEHIKELAEEGRDEAADCLREVIKDIRSVDDNFADGEGKDVLCAQSVDGGHPLLDDFYGHMKPTWRALFVLNPARIAARAILDRLYAEEESAA